MHILLALTYQKQRETRQIILERDTILIRRFELVLLVLEKRPLKIQSTFKGEKCCKF